jgi:hypothetical protein
MPNVFEQAPFQPEPFAMDFEIGERVMKPQLIIDCPLSKRQQPQRRRTARLKLLQPAARMVATEPNLYRSNRFRRYEIDEARYSTAHRPTSTNLRLWRSPSSRSTIFSVPFFTQSLSNAEMRLRPLSTSYSSA